MSEETVNICWKCCGAGTAAEKGNECSECRGKGTYEPTAGPRVVNPLGVTVHWEGKQ